MGKPIKFRAINPRIRIVNRCIVCGRVTSQDRIICIDCAHGTNRNKKR